MVHPVKRGQALRGTLPLTDLVCDVSQSSQQSQTSGARRDQGRPARLAEVTEVNLPYPLCKDWGAAERGRGKERNTPPVALLESSMRNTGSSS